MWTLWWPKFNWWSNLFIFEVFYSDPVSGRKVWRQFWSSPSFLSSSGQVKVTFFFSLEIFNMFETNLDEGLTNCWRAFVRYTLLWLYLLWLRLRGLIHFQTKLYPMLESPFPYWHCSVLRGPLIYRNYSFWMFPLISQIVSMFHFSPYIFQVLSWLTGCWLLMLVMTS